MTRDVETLAAEIRARLPSPLPQRLGVAVSGGGDSVALLDLLADALKDEDVTLLAATVDHGLRPEAAAEAAQAARLAAALGIEHETLRWQGWDGSGNLQDQARQARYRLLTDWAGRMGTGVLAFGHTADDQAETVLMRLGRAAGVTGLAAMSHQRWSDGVLLLRPMLGITRARLRSYLRARGLTWIEDPSNQDSRFDRIKARDVLAQLAPLGITATTLAEVAHNMTQARDALDQTTQAAAQRLTQVDGGDVLVETDGFCALPDEIARRLLIGIVGWITGGTYPPRRAAVHEAMEALRDRRSGAVGGCLMLKSREKMRFCREYNAVRGVEAPVGQPWDGRWLLDGPQEAGAVVRALGPDGLRQVPDWRATGRPYAALKASPAVWRGDELLAAPLAGLNAGWRATLSNEAEEFPASFLSH